jgi:hypothetical protein
LCWSSTRNDTQADDESDSDDRSSVDIVRTLSLRETRKSTTVNRISRIEGVTCLGRLLSSLKFEFVVLVVLAGDCVLNVVVCVVLVSLRLLQWLR